jgi:hypothetical protein
LLRSAIIVCACLLPAKSATAAEVTVCAAGAPTCKYNNLQAAVDAARDGDTIILASGEVFAQDVVLPATPHLTPVVIRSSVACPDRRVTAADVGGMATLRPGHVAEAVITGAGVRGWEFECIRFDSPGGYYNHVYIYNERLGDGSFRNSTDITFDRIVIVGSDPNSTRTGLYLNGSDLTVTKSHIANIHKQGEESKAIVLQEGPGPFTITDNYLEAASINVLFGGGDTSSSAHIANNILVEGNHLYKKPEWAGGPYATKNIFELKTATNVVVRNNLMENNWSGGQDGYAILFQPVNDTANSPWNKVTDVVFEQNTIRGVENGINILGYEWQTDYTSSQTTRVTFRDNLFRIQNRFLKAGGEVGILTIEHNTIDNGGPLGAMYFGGVHPAGGNLREATAAIQNLTFRNNLLYLNGGLSGDGTAPGMSTLQTYVNTLTWTHNVLANRIGSQTYPNTNWYPSSAEHKAQFKADYTLVAGSTYKNAGSDGQDLGRVLGTIRPPTATGAPVVH